MVATFASSTTAPATNAALGTSTSINVPASSNGDLLILLGANTYPVAFTAPAAFTARGNNPNVGSLNDLAVASWTRTAASEPASYTISYGTNNATVGLAMLRYIGAAATSIAAQQLCSSTVASPGSATLAGAALSPAPSLSSVAASDTVVAVYYFSPNALGPFTITTPPSGAGWTSRLTYGPTMEGGGGSGVAQLWFAVLDITGQTGTVTAPTNAVASTAGPWAVQLFRIPAAAPPATPASILNIGTTAGRNHFGGQFSRSGDASIITKTCAEIAAGYAEPTYFVPNAGGTAVVFRAPADGPTTSGSSFARAEVREAGEDGLNYAFDPMDGKVHYIKGTSAITHHATSGTDIDGTGIVLAQLHNGTTDRVAFRTHYVNGTMRQRLRINGSTVTGSVGGSNEIASGTADATGSNIWNPAGTILWPWMIKLYGGDGTNCTCEFWVNNALWHSTTDLVSTGSASWYFKAGCYLQYNTSNVAASEYGEVWLRGLEHWHTGWATPGSGGSSALPPVIVASQAVARAAFR